MNRKISIGILIMLIAVLGFGIYANVNRPKVVYVPAPNLNAPIEIPAENVYKLSDVQDSNKPVLALFYVDWCGYCRRFMPVFGEMAQKYDKYNFVAINCDYPENRELVEEIGIISYPSLVVLDKENDFRFSLSPAATQYEDYMKNELQSYLRLREKLNNKKVDKGFFKNIIVHK